jgi:hypothetical protein
MPDKLDIAMARARRRGKFWADHFREAALDDQVTVIAHNIYESLYGQKMGAAYFSGLHPISTPETIHGPNGEQLDDRPFVQETYIAMAKGIIKMLRDEHDIAKADRPRYSFEEFKTMNETARLSLMFEPRNWASRGEWISWKMDDLTL